MLERDDKVGKYPVIPIGILGVINRNPDIVCFVRLTDDSSDGTGLLHKRAGIRADNIFTACNQKSEW